MIFQAGIWVRGAGKLIEIATTRCPTSSMPPVDPAVMGIAVYGTNATTPSAMSPVDGNEVTRCKTG